MENFATTFLQFLQSQQSAYGGNREIEAGLWALFALSATDLQNHARVQALLAKADFSHAAGESHDDTLMIYYVDQANRAQAIHWLDDQIKQAAGEIRPVAPADWDLISELLTSDHPHRAARQLGERHGRGEISAGLISAPERVRQMLDRMHAREPLFSTAVQTLLRHHLIDLLALFRQIITEDLTLCNEIVKGGLSRDPFLQSRQDATVDIRNTLIAFHLINPMDQMKNIAITNPYAAYLELAISGAEVYLPIDGLRITLTKETFRQAIHTVRRKLYAGQAFAGFNTQSPWVTADLAYPFRFIKQLMAEHPDLAPLDALYMLERALLE